MDIIVLWLLISINYFGARNLLNSLRLSIRILRLDSLLQHNHLWVIILLDIWRILYVWHLGGWLTDVELRANLNLHWGYSLRFFLVRLWSSLGLVWPILRELGGRNKVGRTFLKFVLAFLRVSFLLETTTLAHLSMASRRCWSSLLHLCGHHSLVSFLFIKIDAIVNNLALIMEKPLDRSFIDDLFTLVYGCIQELLIVLDFGWLQSLQSLIALWRFSMHLLIINMHLVPLSIGEHVLGRKWLLFCKSLIRCLMMLYSAKIGRLIRI